MATSSTGDAEALGQLAGRWSYRSAWRIFRIIDRVSLDGEGLAVKALARDLGISISTCYHLVSILIDEGYVEKLPHRAGYRLGPTISVLFERSRRSGTAARVEPVLRRLARIADRPAYFAVLSATNDVVVTHAHAPPDCPLIGVPQGFCGPAYALALGKVLIAGGGSAAIHRYIEQHDLRAFTPRTLTDAGHLEAHLKAVRTRGYATDFEEFANNLCGVAVPVSDESGKLSGAVGLKTSATSPPDELRRLVRLAHNAAREISTALHGEGVPRVFAGLSA
jgi:IclR family acetate operon transcriptional repressor